MNKLIFISAAALVLIWTMGQVGANESVVTLPDPSASPAIFSNVQESSSQKVSPLEERRRFNKLSKATPQIYKVTMHSNVVFKLQTAVGYVSLIDLPEEALKVFVGDQELFKVEVYEREVLIKPITDYADAKSNLTIFTTTGRLSFEVTVGASETADFVLDFRFPEEDAMVENAFKKALDKKYGELEDIFDEKVQSVDESVKNLALKKMRQDIAQGAQVVKLGKGEIRKGVKLELLTLSNVGDQSYLSFKITNQSNRVYKVSHAVLGFQHYKRIWLGLRKVPAEFVEINSQLDMKNSVGTGETGFGVMMFENQSKDKKGKPVVRLFEEDGDRHFTIRGFKWIP